MDPEPDRNTPDQHAGQTQDRQRQPACCLTDFSKPRFLPPIERVMFTDTGISVWGWPSRGGLIVLDHAGIVEFDHLGLNRFKLQLHRDNDRESEDIFCQELLRLGAGWFDSRERFGFVMRVADDSDPDLQAISDGRQPEPSDRERRWVSVGIASDGLWVLEYDQVMFGATEEDNIAPEEVFQLNLARTMKEKIEMLKPMGAKFYRDIGDYEGLACINSWATKTGGEFALMEKGV